ncbi:hypothetical protein ACG7TL_001944 [Trametes sanguinea]
MDGLNLTVHYLLSPEDSCETVPGELFDKAVDLVSSIRDVIQWRNPKAIDMSIFRRSCGSGWQLTKRAPRLAISCQSAALSAKEWSEHPHEDVDEKWSLEDLEDFDHDILNRYLLAEEALHSNLSGPTESSEEMLPTTSAEDEAPQMTSILGKRENSYVGDSPSAKHPRLERRSLFRVLPQPHFRPSPTTLRKPWLSLVQVDGFKAPFTPIPPHTADTVEEYLSDIFARVAWIIPVRGCLGWHTATPAFVIVGDPTSESPRSEDLSFEGEDGKRGCSSIKWTEQSLLEFWDFLQGLRDAGNFGALALAFNVAHTLSVAPSLSPLLVSITLVAALSEARPPNVVDLGYARYEGNISYPNTVAYLGIPYAEPPVGDRRFRAPLQLDTARVARESGGKVVAANVYPDFCVQGSTGAGEAGGAGSEDCLKVNIYAPAGAKEGDQLPVLVYIHGGGYVFGNPANWPFDHWIHQSPNVVIVSVYYRLDSFGFLSVPELADSTVGDLNAGFQDQIQALKWVQQHIGAFGGDPGQVTINGESAGGSSVELHLVAHEGQKLFSQAIAQSVYRTPLPTPEQQRPLFDFYAAQAGCGSSSESVESRVACLRKASVSALARAQDAAMYNFTGAYNAFHPVLDGKLFTALPTESILSGNFADVPVVVGSTSNETLSFNGNITSALKTFFPGLTSEDLAEYLEHYPESEFDSAAQRFMVATGESELICARAIIGQAAARKSKAYTYRYNQAVPTSGSDVVGHASENWMMFRGTSTGYGSLMSPPWTMFIDGQSVLCSYRFNGTTTFQPQRPIDKAFASELIAYWLSFVRSGNPNTHKLARSPVWPEYTLQRKSRIVLQEGASTDVSGSEAELEPQAESSRCAFVASKAAHEQD